MQQVCVETLTTSWLTTFWPSVVLWRELQWHLPIHGKQTLTAVISPWTSETPAARVLTRVWWSNICINRSAVCHLQAMKPHNHSVSLLLAAKYAHYWCSKLTDPKGVFSACHSVISPDHYKEVCLQRRLVTINTLTWLFKPPLTNASYARTACTTAATAGKVRIACAPLSLHMCMHVQKRESNSTAGGQQSVVSKVLHFSVILWPRWSYLTLSILPLGKFSTSCPKGTIYGYNMTLCNRTCQSLGQTDYSCQTTFTPVDGCGCAEGTYMNEDNKCVAHEKCPCYHEDMIIKAGEAFSKDGHTWYTHSRFTL